MPIRALKLLTGFLRPYPWILPLVALLGTAASLAEGIGIGLLIPFLAFLMQGATPEGGFGGQGSRLGMRPCSTRTSA